MPKCKSKTKFLPATFAWILLLGTTSLFFAFPCLKWYIMEQHWYAVPVFQVLLFLSFERLRCRNKVFLNNDDKMYKNEAIKADGRKNKHQHLYVVRT